MLDFNTKNVGFIKNHILFKYIIKFNFIYLNILTYIKISYRPLAIFILNDNPAKQLEERAPLFYMFYSISMDS